jgi:Spy/CpxP family protein refolding chaperone
MKRNLFTLAVAGLLSTFTLHTAMAQTDVTADKQPKRWNKGERQNGKGLESLNLTESQKGKVKEIQDRYKVQADKLKNTPLTVEDRKKQMEVLRKKRHEEIKSVLTPEQAQQLDERAKNRKDGPRGKRMRAHQPR